MSRLQWLLIGVIALELIGGGALIVRNASRAHPPLPDPTLTDAAAAEDLRTLAAICRSGEDWRSLALNLMASGFFAEAEACYRQVAKMQPHDPIAAYEWGFSLSRIGKTSEAIKQFRNAIELKHESPEKCWYFVGRNYLREEKPDEAIQSFGKAGELAAARYELARLYFRKGKFAQARSVLNPVLKNYRRAIESNWLAQQIEDALKNGQASAHYKDLAEFAREMLPTPFSEEHARVSAARNKFGRMKFYHASHRAIESGDLDLAAQHLQSALEARWEATALESLADIEEMRARRKSDINSKKIHFTKAAGFIRRILNNSGPSTQYHWRLGDLQAAAGKIGNAQASWKKAAQFRSEENIAGIYENLKFAANQSGNPFESRMYQATFLYHNGVELFRAGLWSKSEQTLKTAAQIQSDKANTWHYLGEIYRLAARKGEARKAYNRCLKINPEHGRARAGLDRVR